MTEEKGLLAALGDLTRPIIGIENRTSQEAFDIMVDRIQRKFAALTVQAHPAGDDGEKRIEDGHADTEGEVNGLFAHLNCPTCGGSGHIDDTETHPRPDEAQAQSGEGEVVATYADTYAAFTDGLKAAAEICGSLAETTYDDSDGFEAATGCEAAIMAVVKDQRRHQIAHPAPASDAGEAVAAMAEQFMRDHWNDPFGPARLKAKILAALSTTGTPQDQGERA